MTNGPTHSPYLAPALAAELLGERARHRSRAAREAMRRHPATGPEAPTGAGEGDPGATETPRLRPPTGIVRIR